ncbi:DUF2500 domain-containing protein [Brevibacillus massiliensis]|jgi:hypothetical protein|uniref:DUF2500 domain-containing protein n=1 Tax=Brevibacillus massiliensis TaxID=1118054 RepID=UPI000303D10B|nr:DUF2500 domain-containing protein [Brevibacillus massiliensis]
MGMGPGFGDAFFSGKPPFFLLFFLAVAGFILFGILRTVRYYVKNATSPMLTTRARVIAKRIEVTGHTSMHNNEAHRHSRTYYYVTFETPSGERMELVTSGREYGLLVEGDEGVLTYQGEWYKSFQRSQA